MSVIQKYLSRYAEPESKLAEGIAATYAAVLVVPAYRESVRLCEGYRAAALKLEGRLLIVLVVNARQSASELDRKTNDELLSALRDGSVVTLSGGCMQGLPKAWIVNRAEFDVLVIDRSSVGFEFPEKQGVGLARRIGADVALALKAQGKVGSALICCTDADSVLPPDYFTRALGAVELVRTRAGNQALVSALLFPFRHCPSGDAVLDQATLLYDASLRYYVLGLAFAGSPYAYESIGSTFAVNFESYATVRGFPKLRAAEDFYLLDKLAKVGALVRLSGKPIEIAARWSDRVPFGTGKGASDIAASANVGQGSMLYDPRVFAGLRAWLSGMNGFVEHRDLGRLRHELERDFSVGAAALVSSLEKLEAFSELQEASRAVAKRAVLLRRLHTWFDALKTLRLIHELRDAQFPKLAFTDALARASFVPNVTAETRPEQALTVLIDAEAALPVAMGPAVLAS